MVNFLFGYFVIISAATSTPTITPPIIIIDWCFLTLSVSNCTDSPFLGVYMYVVFLNEQIVLIFCVGEENSAKRN